MLPKLQILAILVSLIFIHYWIVLVACSYSLLIYNGSLY